MRCTEQSEMRMCLTDRSKKQANSNNRAGASDHNCYILFHGFVTESFFVLSIHFLGFPCRGLSPEAFFMICMCSQITFSGFVGSSGRCFGYKPVRSFKVKFCEGIFVFFAKLLYFEK